MDNRKDFLGRADLTVSEAMQMIDKNASGILFLTDDKGKLIGCITDGDIRRYLLAGGKMSGAAVDASNKRPKAAKTINEARQLYHKRDYVAIPILGEDGSIMDLYSGESGKNNRKPRNALKIPVVINAGGKELDWIHLQGCCRSL